MAIRYYTGLLTSIETAGITPIKEPKIEIKAAGETIMEREEQIVGTDLSLTINFRMSGPVDQADANKVMKYLYDKLQQIEL
jgi:hypothetical protein